MGSICRSKKVNVKMAPPLPGQRGAKISGYHKVYLGKHQLTITATRGNIDSPPTFHTYHLSKAVISVPQACDTNRMAFKKKRVRLTEVVTAQIPSRTA